jgi:hypothetical protein
MKLWVWRPTGRVLAVWNPDYRYLILHPFRLMVFISLQRIYLRWASPDFIMRDGGPDPDNEQPVQSPKGTRL